MADRRLRPHHRARSIAIVTFAIVAIAAIAAGPGDARAERIVIRVEMKLEDTRLRHRLVADKVVANAGAIDGYLSQRLAKALGKHLPIFRFTATEGSPYPVLYARMYPLGRSFSESASRLELTSAAYPGVVLAELVVLDACDPAVGDECDRVDFGGTWLDDAVRDHVRGGRDLDRIFNAYPIRQRVSHARGWASLDVDIGAVGLFPVNQAIFVVQAPGAGQRHFLLCTTLPGRDVGPFIEDFPPARVGRCPKQVPPPAGSTWAEFRLVRWFP